MNENNNYKIIKNISVDDYSRLVFSLYKDYPIVAHTKINEFKKAFSLDNPFFKYGKVENYFVIKNNEPIAHVSAIIDSRVKDIGFIGFFECIDTQDCANLLFQNTVKFFKSENKTKCCGPINISTWQSFRVSFGSLNKPFFLEPFTLPYYKDLFISNNFVIAHHNITTSESIENTKIKEYEDFYNQSIQNGFTFELITEKSSREDILDFYYLTNDIFKDSYLFRTISEKEFLYFADQYASIPKPNYIFLLKNKENKSVGFFFAVPDLYNPELKRVVLKTTGVLSSFQGKGLGKAMFYFIYKNAKNDGFKEFIFSTMATGNDRIQELTGKDISIYRKYEVYEKNIA